MLIKLHTLFCRACVLNLAILLLQAVGKVSLAARGLCLWVRAMEVYGNVAKEVAPKRAKLKAAQDTLARKQAALAVAQTALAEVLAKVQMLRVSPISLLRPMPSNSFQFSLPHDKHAVENMTKIPL